MRKAGRLIVVLALLATLIPSPCRADQTFGASIYNSADAAYQGNGSTLYSESRLSLLFATAGRLRDWVGQMADLTGGTVALYDPDPNDPTHTNLGKLTRLTATGAGTAYPTGLAPNITNANPFQITAAAEDSYIFLLDGSRGQLDSGRDYIIDITPPPASKLTERRVLLSVGRDLQGQVSVTVDSLDGLPVHSTLEQPSGLGSVTYTVPTAPDGLALVDPNVTLYPPKSVRISLVADRATAEPSDAIVYRVTVTNSGSGDLSSIDVTGDLSPGLKFAADSVRAQSDTSTITVAVRNNGRSIDLRPDVTLPPGHSVTMAYTVQVTAEAGGRVAKNEASVVASATTSSGGSSVTRSVGDGPALASVYINLGLLSDTGTLVGRVFWDKNGDGTQENDEPGIAGAVVVLDNGDRITADADGMFSAPALSNGYHDVVVDLASVPDYLPERSRHFIGDSGASRLIRMEPGGMARVSIPMRRRSHDRDVGKAGP